MTLYRRHQQFNMLYDHGGITIQYQELVEILQQMRAEHPYQQWFLQTNLPIMPQ